MLPGGVKLSAPTQDFAQRQLRAHLQTGFGERIGHRYRLASQAKRQIVISQPPNKFSLPG
jgi:hypothetical protein